MGNFDSKNIQAYWVKLTFAGWFLGFLFTLIFTFVWEMIGSTVQFTAAMGFSLGLGMMQSRFFMRYIPDLKKWPLHTVAGFTIPFLIYDLSNRLVLEIPFNLAVFIIVSSLLSSYLQARLLNKYFENTYRWIIATLVSWLLIALLISLQDLLNLRGMIGGISFLLALLSGGIVLGFITAKTMLSFTKEIKK